MTDQSAWPRPQYGLPHVFTPINVGTLALTQRVVVPPHGGGNGNLMGTPDEFEQHCALWLAKVNGGMQWVGSRAGHRRWRRRDRAARQSRRHHPMVPVSVDQSSQRPLRRIVRQPPTLCARHHRSHSRSSVAVIVEDDGPAPLSVADHLAGLGHAVTLISRSPGPAPLVGKYSLGSMLARLVDDDVEFVSMARVTSIHPDHIELASTFGTRHWTVGGFDTVVLACGSIPNDSLYLQLKHRHPHVYLLGDAYAPRRVVFATRQAWALADEIDQLAVASALTQGASHGQ
jgi:hypothetical protein